VRESRDP
jgi:hypothetical protein